MTRRALQPPHKLRPQGAPSPEELQRLTKSDKEICANECGARCCRASVIPLTPHEADYLPQLAYQLGLTAPKIVSEEPVPPEVAAAAQKRYLMYALPCTFLSKQNLCLIYRDRPNRCRAFPDKLLEWCPLSWKRSAHPSSSNSAISPQ